AARRARAARGIPCGLQRSRGRGGRRFRRDPGRRIPRRSLALVSPGAEGARVSRRAARDPAARVHRVVDARVWLPGLGPGPALAVEVRPDHRGPRAAWPALGLARGRSAVARGRRRSLCLGIPGAQPGGAGAGARVSAVTRWSPATPVSNDEKSLLSWPAASSATRPRRPPQPPEGLALEAAGGGSGSALPSRARSAFAAPATGSLRSRAGAWGEPLEPNARGRRFLVRAALSSR